MGGFIKKIRLKFLYTGSRLLGLLQEMAGKGLKTVQTQLQSAAEIKPKSISILQHH
jgi:hypothetical protein